MPGLFSSFRKSPRVPNFSRYFANWIFEYALKLSYIQGNLKRGLSIKVNENANRRMEQR